MAPGRLQAPGAERHGWHRACAPRGRAGVGRAGPRRAEPGRNGPRRALGRTGRAAGLLSSRGGAASAAVPFRREHLSVFMVT